VYHTSAQGAKLAEDPRQHEHTPLGRHGHLVQLNAAGRQVSMPHDALQPCANRLPLRDRMQALRGHVQARPGRQINRVSMCPDPYRVLLRSEWCHRMM